MCAAVCVAVCVAACVAERVAVRAAVCVAVRGAVCVTVCVTVCVAVREIEKFTIRRPPMGEKDDYDSENSWLQCVLQCHSHTHTYVQTRTHTHTYTYTHTHTRGAAPVCRWVLNIIVKTKKTEKKNRQVIDAVCHSLFCCSAPCPIHFYLSLVQN